MLLDMRSLWRRQIRRYWIFHNGTVEMHSKWSTFLPSRRILFRVWRLCTAPPPRAAPAAAAARGGWPRPRCTDTAGRSSTQPAGSAARRAALTYGAISFATRPLSAIDATAPRSCCSSSSERVACAPRSSHRRCTSVSCAWSSYLCLFASTSALSAITWSGEMSGGDVCYAGGTNLCAAMGASKAASGFGEGADDAHCRVDVPLPRRVVAQALPRRRRCPVCPIL